MTGCKLCQSLCSMMKAMTIRERALNVAEQLGCKTLPEKMRIASEVERELIAVLEAAAVDLEGNGISPSLNRHCAEAAALHVRYFIKTG